MFSRINCRTRLLVVCCRLVGFVVGAIFLGSLSVVSNARAQAIFSFEDDLQSWESTQVTLSQTAFGATDGSFALLIDDLTSGFKNNVATTPNFGPSTSGLSDAFDAFALAGSVIANGGTPRLEFDLAWDFTNYVPAANNFIQLGIFVNSSTDPNGPGGGFHDLGTGSFLTGNIEFNSWPTLTPTAAAQGVTITNLQANSAHISVPFFTNGEMSVSNPSTFYDIGFQSNGGYGGNVDFAVDNFYFSGVPVFDEHTLFSWETPDDANTPGVDERLEGWVSAEMPATQNLSVVATGATDGNSALQLDRRPLETGFTWGSAFPLASDIDPDPNVEVIDPTIQGRIDDFITRINDADRVAVDITYQSQIPQGIVPSFTQIWLAFNDGAGNYYQAGSSNIDLNAASSPVTKTLYFDIADFEDNSDPNNPLNLAVDGLFEGSNTFAIVLGTSTDAGAIYHLDNLRLLTELPSVDADFDGDVDGLDFLILQRENPELIPLWDVQYGTGALSGLGEAVAAVPEPASAWLCLCGLGWGIAAWGRRSR